MSPRSAFPSYVSFTDGVFNHDNAHLWADENLHGTRQHAAHHHFSVQILAGVVGNHLALLLTSTSNICRPFCKRCYQACMNDPVPQRVRHHMWFQHVGAPPDALGAWRSSAPRAPNELKLALNFFDESRFSLSSDDKRVRVWKPHGERLNPAFTLQRYTAPTAAQRYVHDNLQPHVLPLMLPGTIFPQNNDRSHTARVSQNCLRTVTTLPWPDRFQDLSPIEHIWDHLGRRVGHSTSLIELEAR
ncbi:transposable element Tcb2 transposase [Trichonephila clavipes]|nr:transposable element Tcb2 transposase [Trichonephila clavipes]